MKAILYLLIKVEVETSHADIHDAITELQTQTAYSIGSTSKVRVLDTKIIHLQTKKINK